MTTYAYDGNGNLRSKTDADGYKSEYTYNCLDLATSINYNGAKSVQYRYNKTGDLVYMKDWLGESSLEVDRLHQFPAATDYEMNFTNHGNPVQHAKGPHAHQWDWTDPVHPARPTVPLPWD